MTDVDFMATAAEIMAHPCGCAHHRLIQDQLRDPDFADAWDQPDQPDQRSSAMNDTQPTDDQRLQGLMNAINWHHTGADNQRPAVSEVLDTARQFAEFLAGSATS